MKRIVVRIFIELYHWQNDNWGQSALPKQTALLILSALQFLNILSILMIVENLFSINLSNFFSDYLAIGMIIPTSLLFTDYIIVRPLDVTIKENPLNGKRITWIYVLTTILLLVASIAWTIYNNERSPL